MTGERVKGHGPSLSITVPGYFMTHLVEGRFGRNTWENRETSELVTPGLILRGRDKEREECSEEGCQWVQNKVLE